MIPRAFFFTNNKKPLSLDDLKCVLSRAEWKFMQFNCGSSFQATPARLFFGLKISKTFATIETWRERKKCSFDEELNRKNGSGSKSAFSTTFIATKGEDIRRNPPLFLVVDYRWVFRVSKFLSFSSFLETTTTVLKKLFSDLFSSFCLLLSSFISSFFNREQQKERVFLLILFCEGARTRTQTTDRVEVKHVVHAQTVPELRHLHHNERWPAHCRSLAWLRSTNKSYSWKLSREGLFHGERRGDGTARFICSKRR